MTAKAMEPSEGEVGYYYNFLMNEAHINESNEYIQEKIRGAADLIKRQRREIETLRTRIAATAVVIELDYPNTAANLRAVLAPSHKGVPK